MIKIKYVLALLLLTSGAGFAQELLTTLGWNVGFPVGKTAEYVSDVSYRGFTISGKRFLDRENAIGFMTGWNIFDEKVTTPIDVSSGTGSGTISGVQVHSINSFPLMAGFFHFYGNPTEMRIYGGVNVGTYYILQRLEMGVFIIDNDNWHFAVAPEAGFIFSLDGEATGIQVNTRYNYAFDSGTGVGGAENNYYSFWEVSVGFTISSRWF